MAHTIRISDEDMAILREEADAKSRTIAGQVAHWMKIGRAIEKSPNFDYQRITEMLKGRTDPDTLSLEEQEVFFDQFADLMTEPSAEEEAFFAERRKQGLGVGLDDDNNLVYQQPDS